MNKIYEDLRQLEKHINDIENSYKNEYEILCDELRNYINKRNIREDEVGKDLLAIINNHPRLCAICSKPMYSGFCVEHGCEYYCSDECLHEVYSDEEWKEMYDDGNGDSYWTQWEDE